MDNLRDGQGDPDRAGAGGGAVGGVSTVRCKQERVGSQAMTKPPLGKLEAVLLREYWEKEDTDFTPWLGQPENLKLLGDAIGKDLEPQGQEVGVGPFRADLLCRDTATGNLVLIENQIEQTTITWVRF